MNSPASFAEDLSAAVARQASTRNLVDSMAFAEVVAERLSSEPSFGNFVLGEYIKTIGKRNIRIHGYTEVDDVDGSIGLVAADWDDSDSEGTLKTADIEKITSGMLGFVEKSVFEDLYTDIVESSAAYEISRYIAEHKSFISKVRLHIFSNRNLSSRFNEELLSNVESLRIERIIWDASRLKSMFESTQERLPIQITLSEFDRGVVPCIKATSHSDITSYLCVIGGNLLADIFERYGSRLLEGNVRAFLGMKGGVNKGIRATISKEPDLFFAYNNGISATATSVVVGGGRNGEELRSVYNLQIVNGGQTTASILSCRKKEGLSLDAIYVQMKLTVVGNEKAEAMVPNIAKYANTQNKVAVADFFSNHPFHVHIADMSRRLLVPARAGVRKASKWFYERARGEYEVERMYLSSSKRNNFDLEYPKEQRIEKTDLAKYDSLISLEPHNISLGAQKNFQVFSRKFFAGSGDLSEADHWSRVREKYGDIYYKRIVAGAILWDCAEKIISAARNSWYSGDYRPQIAAYGLCGMLFWCKENKGEFDYEKLWNDQGVDEELTAAIARFCEIAANVVSSPTEGKTNYGEWCKSSKCWDSMVSRVRSVRGALDSWGINRADARERVKSGVAQGKVDSDIARQKLVIEYAYNGFWARLLTWKLLEELVPNPGDIALITRAADKRTVTRVSLPAEWRRLETISQRCSEAGFS